MQKVILGRLYDTDIATEIGNHSNGLSVNDFYYFDETLYITKKGAFFLAGEGGAASKYSEPVGNMRGSGSDINRLSREEALYWCENHNIDPDIIQKYFRIEEA